MQFSSSIQIIFIDLSDIYVSKISHDQLVPVRTSG